jgi:hypothetical protein
MRSKPEGLEGAQMKIHGRCHCGSVSYETVIDPNEVEICHCTDCQTLSGSAFRIVVPTSEADFRLLSGELKTYVKTAESGNKRLQLFCPECGTSIYSTSVGGISPKTFGLRVATAHQRASLPPKGQFWARSALPWITDIASLPRSETE